MEHTNSFELFFSFGGLKERRICVCMYTDFMSGNRLGSTEKCSVLCSVKRLSPTMNYL